MARTQGSRTVGRLIVVVAIAGASAIAGVIARQWARVEEERALCEALLGDDPARHDTALERLEELGTARCVPSVVEAIVRVARDEPYLADNVSTWHRQEDLDTRRILRGSRIEDYAGVIDRLGPLARAPLTRELRADEPDRRFWAAWLLGRGGPRNADAVPALSRLVAGEDEDLARQAAISVGRLGWTDPERVAPYEHWLARDRAPSLERLGAIETLKVLALESLRWSSRALDPAFPDAELRGRSGLPRRIVLAVARETPQRVAAVFIEQVRSGPRETRAETLAALSYLATYHRRYALGERVPLPGTETVFREILAEEDASERVQLAALGGLLLPGAPSAESSALVVAVILDPSRPLEVRERALEWLAPTLAAREHVRELLPVALDESTSLQEHARGLVKQHASEVAEDLAAALGSADEPTARWILGVLERLATVPSSLVDPLETFSRKAPEGLRRRARILLASPQTRSFEAEADPAAESADGDSR